MKHIACNNIFPGEVIVRGVSPLFLQTKVRFNAGKVDRIGSAELVSDSRMDKMGLPESYIYFCTKCNKFVPVNEIKFEIRCVCQKELGENSHCKMINRSVCNDCYEKLMLRFCVGCEYQETCALYHRNHNEE